jgi:hypothetical protein
LGGVALSLELRSQLLGLVFCLPQDNIVVDQLGGAAFGVFHDLLGVFFGLGQQIVTLAQQIFGLPEGFGQMFAHQVELIEKVIFMYQRPAEEMAAVNEQLFQAIEFTLDVEGFGAIVWGSHVSLKRD